MVLLGTLLPLVHKEIGLGSISIGEPFFNQMFTYLIVPFVMLLAIGPLSRWKRQSLGELKMQMVWAVSLGILMTALLLSQFELFSMLAVLGSFLAFVILITTVQEIVLRSGKAVSLKEIRKLTLSHWGMVSGHIGFAILLLGIAITSNFEEEREVKMFPGDTVTLQGYTFRFDGVIDIDGPNYDADGGKVTIFQNDRAISTVIAEKRFYPVQRTTMTEAGIDSNILRDLFVALGEQFPDGAWGLRVYVKPFVVWIWFGAAIMAFGALLSICDKRYRLKKIKKVAARAKSPANGTSPNMSLQNG